MYYFDVRQILFDSRQNQCNLEHIEIENIS